MAPVSPLGGREVIGVATAWRQADALRDPELDISSVVDRTYALQPLMAAIAAGEFVPTRNTVLVVDDDPAVRDRLRAMLTREGWAVSDAENGRVALRRVAEARPSLVLLDLAMPELDGFGFLKELRSRPEWQTIPVVVVTAQDVTAEDRARLGGEADHIVRKSGADMQELLAEVRRAIGPAPPAPPPARHGPGASTEAQDTGALSREVA